MKCSRSVSRPSLAHFPDRRVSCSSLDLSPTPDSDPVPNPDLWCPESLLGRNSALRPCPRGSPCSRRPTGTEPGCPPAAGRRSVCPSRPGILDSRRRSCRVFGSRRMGSCTVGQCRRDSGIFYRCRRGVGISCYCRRDSGISCHCRRGFDTFYSHRT